MSLGKLEVKKRSLKQVLSENDLKAVSEEVTARILRDISEPVSPQHPKLRLNTMKNISNLLQKIVRKQGQLENEVQALRAELGGERQ